MRRSAFLLAAVFPLLIAACGGDSSSSSGDGGGAEIPGGDSGQTVAVSLGENGADDMYMRLNQESVPGGPVTFVVTNEGQKEHEFIVIKTDTPAGDFPVATGGGMTEGEEEMGHPHDIDEEAAGEVIGEVEDLAAGATDQLVVTLTTGHYALICNLEGHYTGGMWADLQVT